MQLPMLFALTWLCVKVVIFYTSWIEDTMRAGIMLNLLFLVILVYVGVKKGAENGKETFHLLKSGMRPAAIYVIMITVAIFSYYKFLDTDFFDTRLDQVMIETNAGIEQNGGWAEFSKTDGIEKETTQEEFLSNQESSLRKVFFSPLPQASYSLLALTLTAIFYSLLMSLFFKFMASRFKESVPD
jgi:hypothetical protein